MLNNVASGNLDSLNASSALEIYIDFKDYIFNGKALASKALSGLDPETVATLDHLQSATLVTGNTNAAIGDIINQYKESLDPKLKEFYDAKVASYLKLDTELWLKL